MLEDVTQSGTRILECAVFAYSGPSRCWVGTGLETMDNRIPVSLFSSLSFCNAPNKKIPQTMRPQLFILFYIGKYCGRVCCWTKCCSLQNVKLLNAFSSPILVSSGRREWCDRESAHFLFPSFMILSLPRLYCSAVGGSVCVKADFGSFPFISLVEIKNSYIVVKSTLLVSCCCSTGS